ELGWKAPRGKDIIGYHIERAVVEVWTEDQLRRVKVRTPPLKDPAVGALRRIGPFIAVTTDPVKGTRWTDKVELDTPLEVKGKPTWERRFSNEEIDPAGKAYRCAVFAYRVRAVNALGVRGGPSPYVLTIPSAPQWLFSRERGPRCELKWAANPERGIK